MQIIGYLIVISYALGLVILGVMGSSIWTPAIAALFSFAMGHRQRHWDNYAELWHAGKPFLIIQVIITTYAMHALVAAVLYGLGRLIGIFV